MTDINTPAATPFPHRFVPESSRRTDVSLPLVSIITPVHNDAEYLPECIESVLAQTYQNWDYTIVDNCSTDGSAAIAHRYAGRDRRIHVLQNSELLPVIRNHNAALRQISEASKYCKIVFADDFIFPECLERMVAVAEGHPAVGIVGAYSLVGQEVKCVGLSYRTRVADGREVCRRHWLDHRYLWGSANTILYRSDLVRKHDPFYNERNIHADDEVCFSLLKTCDFGFVHQVLTFTRERSDSLTTISNNMCTEFASTLHNLITYGAEYLTPEELKICIEQQLTSYYKVLGKNLLLIRDRRFWDYHRQKLIQAGVGFDRLRVVRAALATLGGAVLNVKETLGKLQKIRRKPNSTRRYAEACKKVASDQIG